MNRVKSLREIWKDGNLPLLIAFCLIVIGAVCFYKADTILVFAGMNVIAGVIVGWHVFAHRGLRIYITPFVVWITLLFGLFLIYGYGFLRVGDFNGDKFIVMYVECLLLYYICKQFLIHNDSMQLFAIGCSICSVVCMIMLCVLEGNILFQQTYTRLGSTLAGNANSVGMSLGLMSLFITHYLVKAKKKCYAILIGIIAIFMMATGSKKALLYLLLDVILLYSNSKSKASGFLKTVIAFSIVAYAVFCVDFFYEIIGVRIIDMLGTLGFQVEGAKYSYSTDSRMIMLEEAYRYWLENPIWGNGMNYFASRSSSGFGYSHSNILELLCSMGLIGCLLYYFPFILTVAKRKIIARVDKKEAKFITSAAVLTFILGFLAVGYSDSCISYLLAIYSFSYYEFEVRTKKQIRRVY